MPGVGSVPLESAPIPAKVAMPDTPAPRLRTLSTVARVASSIPAWIRASLTTQAISWPP